MDELVLRTLVVQFDGRVVEVFGSPSGEVSRHHVAQLTEPLVRAPNRKGRSLVTIGNTSFSVDADELERLQPVLDKIGTAVRAIRKSLAG